MITSRNNEQIKNIRKLMSSKKARDEQGMFVVEGKKMVLEAPAELIRKVYITEGLFEEIKDELHFVKEIEAVSDEVMSYISDTVTPQGILAVLRKCENSFEKLKEDIKNKEELLIVLLDDIKDPGNMGTIIRTSEAAGVDYVIMSKTSTDVTSPKVTRSTMGSIFRVKSMECDLKKCVEFLLQNGVEVFAAAPGAEKNYNDIPYGKKKAFIIGNESNGISEEILKMDIQNIKIPMHGKVESLNAAISLAILLYGCL